MEISENTKLCLQLRCNLNNDENLKPLSNKEFLKLENFLSENNLSLTRLIEDKKILFKIEKNLSLQEKRISSLLNSGVALSFYLDKWSKRGIWVLSSYDDEYPINYKIKLRDVIKPILFGVGTKEFLNSPSLGIVGPRDSGLSSLKYSEKAGAKCAENQISIVTGGARGVDTYAINGALGNGGRVINILTAELFKESINEKYKKFTLENNLILLSTQLPEEGWSIGRAMDRNKYIYALSDGVLVPECKKESGGTWSGIIENQKKSYSTLYFRPSNESNIDNKIYEGGAISHTELNLEDLKRRKIDIDLSKLLVKEIAYLQGKSERAVKGYLTRNSIEVIDYPVRKRTELPDKNSEEQIQKEFDI